MGKDSGSEFDLQAEYKPDNNCAHATVYLTQDASALPRVALGQHDAGMETQEGCPTKSKSSLSAGRCRAPKTCTCDTCAKETEKTPVSPTRPFLPASLEVVFDAKGDEKKIQILQRPLGAEFSKKAKGPTKVSKIHPESYASKLGISVGWVLKSIGGEDVSQKTFQETQTTLKNGLMHLPLAEGVA